MEQKPTILRHQNFMWALRCEMGWPPFKPMNDCIAFCSGRPVDVEVGLELGRIAQAARKDIVYSGWTSVTATEPETFAIAIREVLKIDIVDRCWPWAADETSEVILISTHADECFAIGKRGILERQPGKPKKLLAGRRLAMKRIHATAATMGDELAANNVWVPHGADWTDPEVPTATVVSFN